MKDISEMTSEMAKATEIIGSSQNIVVLTGAGISTDSGIPDFRGPKGIWTTNPEAEKASHIDIYVSDPEIRKNRWRRMLDGNFFDRTDSAPNEGHAALAELEKQGKLHTLITQNVDGLHQKAGVSPEKVVEIHGTTKQVKCLDCGDLRPTEEIIERLQAGEEDPPCQACGGMLKSATISFGQALVADDLLRSEMAAKECDLCLAVGSTLEVYPIAGVVPIASKSGAGLVIVNGDPTPYDPIADVVINASISEVLPKICKSEP